jgi:putative addiction module CopG family antidote
MATIQVTLSGNLQEFVDSTIESGRFHDAGEALIADPRRFEYEAERRALRAALDEGLASGVCDGDPFEDALAEIERMYAEN